MKQNSVRIIAFLFLISTSIFSQSKGISYQAVIYKPDVKTYPGQSPNTSPLINTDICLRFSFLDINKNLEYQEVVTAKTDGFGIVNTMIGLGNQTGGYAASFDKIVWDNAQKTSVVELDLTASCSSFEEISNQFFSSAPFAFSAAVANNVSGVVAIANGGTGGKTVLEAKTALLLDKVDNTADIDKPISIAMQTALNSKEDLLNKSLDVAVDGLSDTKYPTVKAVKRYIDASIGNIVVSDATSSNKGKILLAGDLGGTADAPTIVKLQGVSLSNINPTIGQLIQFNGTSWIPVSVDSVINMNSEEVIPTTGQTIFTATNLPIGKVALFINGIRVPKAAINYSGHNLIYDPIQNGGYIILSSDRINFDYIY